MSKKCGLLSFGRVLFFCLSLLINISCNHLFYHPDSKVYYDLKSLPLDVREGFTATRDGERLQYFDLRPLEPYKAAIVQFHGNAQNQTVHIFIVIWLVDKGYRVVSFDYREYGQSTGVP